MSVLHRILSAIRRAGAPALAAEDIGRLLRDLYIAGCPFLTAQVCGTWAFPDPDPKRRMVIADQEMIEGAELFVDGMSITWKRHPDRRQTVDIQADGLLLLSSDRFMGWNPEVAGTRIPHLVAHRLDAIRQETPSAAETLRIFRKKQAEEHKNAVQRSITAIEARFARAGD